MEQIPPRELLLLAFKYFDLEMVTQSESKVELLEGYTIEIEGNNLFKLLQEGQVIAPFADVEELCDFIKMDMKINEEN